MFIPRSLTWFILKTQIIHLCLDAGMEQRVWWSGGSRRLRPTVKCYLSSNVNKVCIFPSPLHSHDSLICGDPFALRVLENI